jgi:hypothetical protein
MEKHMAFSRDDAVERTKVSLNRCIDLIELRLNVRFFPVRWSSLGVEFTFDQVKRCQRHRYWASIGLTGHHESPRFQAGPGLEGMF